MNVDKDGEEVDKLELEIDGILFQNHPYVDKDFGKSNALHYSFLLFGNFYSYLTNWACFIVLDEDKQQVMCTALKIGGVTVLQPGEYETWSNSMLTHRILKTFGDEPVKDVRIEKVNQTTETTNELLSTID